MNKKYFLAVIVLSVFTVSLVAAGVLTYYAQHTETINVIQPITVNGEEEYTSSSTVDCGLLDSCPGAFLEVLNSADYTIPISVTNDIGLEEEIAVSYTSELELTKKDVDFSLEVWNIPTDAEKVIVEYTIVGNEFTAKVIDNPKVSYELIYYKDNSNRFNSPAKAIIISEVEGNLPYEDDANLDENDYSAEYVTDHGAKIWYVPTNAILDNGELDWSQASEFYFETELIQFNSEGKLIIYPEQTLGLTPLYNPIALLGTGEYHVTTSVNPTA